MSPAGIILLVLSAFFHAGWNLIGKARHPSAAFFLVLTAVAAMLLCPAVIAYAGELPRLPARFWLLLAGTGVSQAVYFIGLGNAYREAEVSVAYPLARALPVLLIPFVTLAFGLGKPVSGAALAAMGVVAAGCVILPFPEWRAIRPAFRWSRAHLSILAAVLGTTGYTVFDSEAMRVMREAGVGGGSRMAEAFLYGGLEYAAAFLCMVPYAMVHPEERRRTKAFLGWNLRRPAAAAVLCVIGYTLVLAAMGHASNVSYVMAFRQLSIPLGMALGIVVLGERVTGPKVAGALLVCGALAAVAVL